MSRENLLTRFGTGLARFGAGLSGTPNPFLERQREEERLKRLGNILSGRSIPAFARPGGAEALSPEAFRETQMRQLGALGTPEAIQFITQLDPGLGRREVSAPSAVREFQFVQGLSPEQQRRFLNLKRADPLRGKGLVETSKGVQEQPGFAQAIESIQRAQETGRQLARSEFEPAREAQKTEAQKRAALRVDLEAAFPALQRGFEAKIAKTDKVLEQIDRIVPS